MGRMRARRGQLAPGLSKDFVNSLLSNWRARVIAAGLAFRDPGDALAWSIEVNGKPLGPVAVVVRDETDEQADRIEAAYEQERARREAAAR